MTYIVHVEGQDYELPEMESVSVRKVIASLNEQAGWEKFYKINGKTIAFRKDEKRYDMRH